MKVDRNAPCPCSSGKKYKKCCALKEFKESLPEQRSPDSQNAPFITEINPKIEAECDRILEKLQATRKVSEAKAAARRLYLLHPNNHVVNFLQASCLIVEEKLDEAIPYLEKAVAVYPLFTEAYYNLANLYKQKGLLLESITCLKKVIKLNGKRGDIGKLAQEDLNSIENIIQENMKMPLDRYLQGAEFFQRAFRCLQEDKNEEAIVLFQQSLSIDPKHVQSYGNMALAYASLGKKQKALECLDKALSFDPEYEPAIINRRAIEQLNDNEELQGPVAEIFYYAEKLATK